MQYDLRMPSNSGRRVAAPALSCLVLSFVLSSCRDLDVVTESYATLDEAVAAGAVERGWIPAGLPASTREIREAHDLDTSRRWGLFNFEPSDAGALRAVVGAELSVQGIVCDPPRRIEWWPVLLRGPLDETQVKATTLRAYGSRQGDLLFFVNWAQGRAYYCTRD
jgi:hypothetical protein